MVRLLQVKVRYTVYRIPYTAGYNIYLFFDYTLLWNLTVFILFNITILCFVFLLIFFHVTITQNRGSLLHPACVNVCVVFWSFSGQRHLSTWRLQAKISLVFTGGHLLGPSALRFRVHRDILVGLHYKKFESRQPDGKRHVLFIIFELHPIYTQCRQNATNRWTKIEC